MLKIKKLILLLTFTIILTELFGAYLTDQPQILTQPDGKILHCFASGDEFHNWLHDENGYTIIQDPETGYFVYADLIGEKLVSTSYIAGQINPATKNLQPGLNAKPEGFEQRVEEFNQILADRRNRVSTIGDLNNLVVFIRFSDQTEFTETFTQYNNLFNAVDESSMYQYFDEVSNEQLDITSHFYPDPNGNLIISYQSPNPRNYYEVYNAVTNPNGYQTDQQRTQREHALLQAAIQFVEAQIPPTLDLDNDDDGLVDNVCFIIKGSTGAWADLLWPHMWVLYSLDVYIHGVQVWTYNFQLSQSLNSSGVGVLCHEMFHSLGAPDLYHYTNNGISPTGSWDLMCANTNPPQHMTTWMKYKYGFWFDEVPEINTTGTYTLEPVVDSPYSCYKIPSPNSNTEFFMVEYRRRTGLFEPSLPGDGMIIYRIDTTLDGNASGPPDEVYLFRPDGTMTNNGNVNQAHFSADVGRTEFNDNTNPAGFLQYGAPGGIFISDIGFIGDTIEFTLNTGLIPMFETNVQTGPAYLGVQFTNTSFPVTGIDSWEWDFDGDGIFDSTEENPFHLYTEPGVYDVTLRIEVDGDFAEITVEDYITVTDSSSVSGNLSGVWVPDFSPYMISEDIVIAEGDELIITEGVEIIFAGNVQFTVNGLLAADASSTRGEPIIFKSESSWNGIRFFVTQEDNIIANCEISDASVSAIKIEGDSKVDVIGCKIFDNNSTSLAAAFEIIGSDNVLISQNIVSNNSSASNAGGIGCTASSPGITNNIIVNNTGQWGAFYFQNDSNPIMINNTIANNESTNEIAGT
ncbi:MAG: M6 family metalloprotease domain-containing protein, partial [FCB group bacterium]|nr:M6 family metalloprotease domain-containing protein [FCB group bacterium]